MSGGYYTGIAALLRGPDGQTIPIEVIQAFIRNQRANAGITHISRDGTSESPFLSEREEANVIQRLSQIEGYIASAVSDPAYGGGTDGFGASFDERANRWDLAVFQESLRRGVEQIIKSIPQEHGAVSSDIGSSLSLSSQHANINRIVAALQDTYINAVDSSINRQASIDYNSPSDLYGGIQREPQGTYEVTAQSLNATLIPSSRANQSNNSVPQHSFGQHAVDTFGGQHANRAEPTGTIQMRFNEPPGVLFPAMTPRNEHHILDVDEAHGGSFLDTSDNQPRPSRSAGQQFADEILNKTFQATEVLKSKGSFRSDSGSGLRWTKSLSRKKSKKKLTRAISNPHLVSTTQRLDNAVDIASLAENPNLVKLRHKELTDEGENTINSAHTMPTHILRTGYETSDPDSANTSGNVGYQSFAYEGKKSYEAPQSLPANRVSMVSPAHEGPPSSAQTSVDTPQMLPHYLISTMYTPSERVVPLDTPITSPMDTKTTLVPPVPVKQHNSTFETAPSSPMQPSQLSHHSNVSNATAEPASVQQHDTPPESQPMFVQHTLPQELVYQAPSEQIQTNTHTIDIGTVPGRLPGPTQPEVTALKSSETATTNAIDVKRSHTRDMSHDPESLLEHMGFQSVPITARKNSIYRPERASVADSNASEEPVQGNRTANLLAQLGVKPPPPIVRPKRSRNAVANLDPFAEQTDSRANTPQAQGDNQLREAHVHDINAGDVISFPSDNAAFDPRRSTILATPQKESTSVQRTFSKSNTRNSTASSLYDMYIGAGTYPLLTQMTSTPQDLAEQSLRATA